MESRLNSSHYNQAYAHGQRIPMDGQPRRCLLPTPSHSQTALTSTQNYPYQQKFPHPPLNPSTSANYPTPVPRNPQNTVNSTPNYPSQKEYPQPPFTNPSTSSNHSDAPIYDSCDLPEGLYRFPLKNYIFCTICESKIRPEVLNVHIATIDHIANGKNVIRRLNELAFKCIICNRVLFNHQQLLMHLKDKNHKIMRSRELDPKLLELKKSYSLPEAIVRSDEHDDFWCKACNMKLKGNKVTADFHASRRAHKNNMRQWRKGPEFGLSRDANQMNKTSSYQSNPPSSSRPPTSSSSAGAQRDDYGMINQYRGNDFPSASSAPVDDLDNFTCESCNIVITGGYWNIVAHRQSQEHQDKKFEDFSDSNPVFNKKILPEGIEYLHHEKFIICLICPKRIHPNMSLSGHMSSEKHRSSRKFFTRLGEKNFNCDICNCTLTSVKRLIRHASRDQHHRRKRFYMHGEPLPVPAKPNYWLEKSLRRANERLPDGIEKFSIAEGGTHWICTICNYEIGYYSRVEEHVASALHKVNGKKVIFKVDDKIFKCVVCHKYLLDYVHVMEHLKENSHREKSGMIGGSGGYVDERVDTHANQHVDEDVSRSFHQHGSEHSNERGYQHVQRYANVDQHVNPHVNEDFNPHVNRHVNSHFDPRVNRHVNEHVNRHFNPHVNPHANEHVSPHFDPYVNRDVSPYDNPHVDEHVNRHVNPHDNQHVHPHSNPHEFIDERTNQHVNEHVNQYDDRRVNPHDNRHVNPHLDEHINTYDNAHIDDHFNRHGNQHVGRHVNPHVNERKRKKSTNESRKNHQQEKSSIDQIERDVHHSKHFTPNEFSIDDFIVRDECYGSDEDGEDHYDHKDKKTKFSDDSKSKRSQYKNRRRDEIVRSRLSHSARRSEALRLKANSDAPHLQPGIIKLAGESSYLCIFCNSSFLPDDAVHHFKAVEHRNKMGKVICRIDRDTYKCKLCQIRLLLKEINEHLQGRNHLKNRALKESKANSGEGLSETELEIAWKKMKNLKKGDSDDDEWDWSTI